MRFLKVSRRRTMPPAWPRIVAVAGMTCLAACLAASRAIAGVDIPTFHGSNARLGWNSEETVLTPSRVTATSFGKLWQVDMDGYIGGSPLVLSGVPIAGVNHDVVYAGTSANSVYAVDGQTGKILWQRLGLRRPLTSDEFYGYGDARATFGILGTPAIDRDANALYVCTVRAGGLRQVYEIWALDIRDGSTKRGWPVIVAGEYRGFPFVCGQEIQRGALAVDRGWVYVPFGGRGDTPPWHGWVLGIDTKHPGHAQRAYCATPDIDGGGVWGVGGVAVDSAGFLYVVTGNGGFDFPEGGHDISESIVRLRPDRKPIFSEKPEDYYVPSNYNELDEADEDLGGSGAIVLPDLPESSTPHLIATGGKDGLAYLINRDNLGGVGGEVEKLRVFGDPRAAYRECIRATPAYFDAGPAGRIVYMDGDQPGPNGQTGLVALQIVTDGPGKAARWKQIWTLSHRLDGSCSPVVSSHGATNGIVWLVEPSDQVITPLHGYDALTGAEIYNSETGPEESHLRGARRFASPTVANGRVYCGANGIACYGLLPTEKGK